MNRVKGNLFRAGFTLIEIMVAMSVLAILVMLIGNIFQQVSASWNIGTHSADANTAARAALNYMAQELSQAVAGPVEASPGAKALYGNDLDNLIFEVVDGEEVRVVTLSGDVSLGSDRRGALRRSAFYWVGGTNLLIRYARQTNRDESYTKDPDQSAGPKELIRNVVDFWMCVYTNRVDLLNGNFEENITLTNSLPVCIDIYLSILGEGDMDRYKALSGNAQDEFRESNAQCYSTRVYFLNRQGYAAR